MNVLDGADHALGHDVVGQAAKGLGRHDVIDAVFNQIQHFAGQQPAFAHLHALADARLGGLLHLEEGGGRHKVAVAADDVGHHRLAVDKQVEELLFDDVAERGAVIQLGVHKSVVQRVEHEVQHAGNHRLRPLRDEIILQIVVAQRGVLHVNLAHDAHLGFAFARQLDLIKGLQNAVEILFQVKITAAGKGLVKLVGQNLDHLIGVAGHHLIRLGLVFQPEDHIAVKAGVDGSHQGALGEYKTAAGLQRVQLHGDDGDMAQAVFLQRLAQQINVVGGTAATAGLGQQQRNMVQVILAAFNGVQQLTNGQQSRVAGVIMHVLQALLGHRVAGVFQKFQVVTLPAEDALQQLKVDGQHLRHQNGMGLLHGGGKLRGLNFVLFQRHFHLFPLGLRGEFAHDRANQLEYFLLFMMKIDSLFQSRRSFHLLLPVIYSLLYVIAQQRSAGLIFGIGVGCTGVNIFQIRYQIFVQLFAVLPGCVLRPVNFFLSILLSISHLFLPPISADVVAPRGSPWQPAGCAPGFWWRPGC